MLTDDLREILARIADGRYEPAEEELELVIAYQRTMLPSWWPPDS